jgi:hypothetical protein
MRNKSWSPEEIAFLKENYPTKGKNYCAELLNREGSSVFKKASRLKLKVNSDIKLANNKIAQLKVQGERPNNDFNINVDQFINIEDPKVAYILGYLWADGYIVRNEVRLEIVKDDLDHIKPILESIGTWTYSYRNRAGNQTSGCATVSNKRLIEFLKDNDYENKSFVSADKIISKIPNELKHYFFRGLVDGDGCIYVNDKKKRLSIASSYNQNWDYVKNICDDLSITSYLYKNENSKGKSSIIEMNGINAKLFIDYIYQDKIFGLSRKYDKAILLIDLYNNSRTKLVTDKKLEALSLYNNGIPITKIIKATGIPSTTLRRFLKVNTQK